MRHGVDTRSNAEWREANTSPNVEASQENRGDSTTRKQDQTGRNEVTLEPCLRLLQKVLTRPGNKFDY
jgi:hypothetical protein